MKRSCADSVSRPVWRVGTRLVPLLALAGLLIFVWTAGARATLEKPVAKPEERWITADHSKFEALKQEFKNGPEVTRACLTCHTEAAAQFQKTIHWTWLCPLAPKEARLGKAGLVVNNFCISVPSNEPRCTSCHAGFGYKDKNFDFTAQDRVDCLVCHEQTGTYKKFPAGAGNPVTEPKPFGPEKEMFYPPDWNKVAQSVARPTRQNCGECHFFGGGGDGVKHGDLDSSMFKPDHDLDVHMDVEGANFNCTRCHTTVVHKISGRCYKTPAAEKRISLLQDDQMSRITCESCHSDKPHKPGVKANDHTDKVACQSCHIPTFARKLPTKVSWDWSTAGKKTEDGKIIMKKGPLGPLEYFTNKGDMRWAKDVVPEYRWFNGSIENVMLTTRIDPGQPVVLTRIMGSADDPNARIYPFKLHIGKQPYDKKNNTMVVPKLFGPKGSGAYWADYDWQKAVQAGMDYVGLPFSGDLGFVETKYYFQTTHQVAPEEKVLACTECHTKNGRLANLTGFYIPGRDASRTLNFLGWAAVLAALAGVLLHGGLRIVTRKKRG